VQRATETFYAELDEQRNKGSSGSRVGEIGVF
jgi:hypothetical protein